MKKIGLICKEVSENRVKKYLKESSGFFVVGYSGLSSPDITALRLALKTTGARMFVVKNSVARRALKEAGRESLLESIKGPCGLIFSADEPVGTSKALWAFSKDHEKLQLEAGFLEEKTLTKKDIEALSKLPSKEVLRAQVVMTLNAPIVKFVMVLNQTLRKFVYCLEQIKNKKGS